MVMETGELHPQQPKPPRRNGRRLYRCWWCCGCITVLLLVLFLIVLILALTVFKPKNPTTTVVSTTVDGVSPWITFLPTLRFEINVTLSLRLLVYNPNRASFAHDQGVSHLFFGDKQVGEAVLLPGRIPARGSETMGVRLTIEADRFASDSRLLIQQVLSGELRVRSRSTVPGRVTFLRIIRRRAIATVECQTSIGVADLKVRSQSCTHKTKL